MSLPWIKLHARLPRHRKSAMLDEMLGRRRTWTYVVQLWLWASEEAPSGDLSGLPPRVIARQAGWTGNPERFVEALRAVGFMDGDRLHDWEEHNELHVEMAERVASPADSTDPADREARRKQKAAERAARKRARDAASKGVTEKRDGVTPRRDASVTERDASRSGSVTQRDGSVTETAFMGGRGEKEIKIQRETGESTARESAHGSPAVAPDSTADASPVEQAVTEVLEHWRDVVWVPTGGSPDAPIDEKRAKNRRKVVRGLLGDGWTVERLKAVCDGVSRDDWLMGRDPKAKAGGWTEVENVFRRSKLEAREKAAAAPRATSLRLPPYDPAKARYDAPADLLARLDAEEAA